MAYSLSSRGDAPRAWSRVRSNGVPATAIIASSVVGFLGVIGNYVLPGEIFGYLLASSGAIALFVYLVIALSQLKMRRELDAEGTEPAVRMWAFPALTYITIAFIVGVLVLMVVRPGLRLELWLSVGAGRRDHRGGRPAAPPYRGSLALSDRPGVPAPRAARARAGAAPSLRPARRAHKGHKSAYRPVVDRMRPMTAAPSVSNSITVRLELPARATAVSELTTAIERSGGLVTGLDVTASGHQRLRVDVTAAARDQSHADDIVAAMRAVHGVEIGKVSDRTFLVHLGGKLTIESKVPIRNRDDLSLIYTPGVARVCLAIAENPEDARRLTIKRNTVAVVTDGSAVLGLGNIGPLAALPVMEGKAALFKRFAGIDAFPICLDTQDVDEIVAAVKAIAPVFAGINLEDISAPRCFEVEARLREELDIPVFHDDQHGTAIVVLAALRNALRVVGKELDARARGDERCGRRGHRDPQAAAQGGRHRRRRGRLPRRRPRRPARHQRRRRVQPRLDRRAHQPRAA